jgi:hypothetical protein
MGKNRLKIESSCYLLPLSFRLVRNLHEHCSQRSMKIFTLPSSFTLRKGVNPPLHPSGEGTQQFPS